MSIFNRAKKKSDTKFLGPAGNSTPTPAPYDRGGILGINYEAMKQLSPKIVESEKCTKCEKNPQLDDDYLCKKCRYGGVEGVETESVEEDVPPQTVFREEYERLEEELVELKEKLRQMEEMIQRLQNMQVYQHPYHVPPTTPGMWQYPYNTGTNTTSRGEYRVDPNTHTDQSLQELGEQIKKSY